jgi:hypothetical protein
MAILTSVAAVKMADQYNWSQSEKGQSYYTAMPSPMLSMLFLPAQVLSAFFYGYILTQSALFYPSLPC